MIQSPDRVLWTKEAFQKPQVGEIIFPDWLEGRSRHVNTALKPMTSIPLFPVRMAKLTEWGVSTFLDFLYADKKIVNRLFGNRKQEQEWFFDYVDKYLHDIAVGPEGRFIATIFEIQNPIPLIPAELEPARTAAIAKALLMIPDKRIRLTIDKRYGVSSGLPMSRDRVAKELSIIEGVISRRITEGRRILRHPPAASLLSSFTGK